jgi:hypothetical protein
LVKIKTISVEKDRVDLATLPKTNILIAVLEEVWDPQPGKTDDLVIWFRQKDGKEFPQKYSKISGKRLVEALKKLGYDDEKKLFEKWHEYRLEAMRTGHPCYIPVKRV